MRSVKHFFIFSLILFSLTECLPKRSYHVSTTGSDETGDGSVERPWKTISFAVTQVPANEGNTIKLSAGTFLENQFMKVPPGIHIIGEGAGITIIRPDSSLYHKTSDWIFNKFLFSLTGSKNKNKSQILSSFTIDGAYKNLYGGILVKDRDNVRISDVALSDIYFTGLWFWGTNNCRISQSRIKNCAWGGNEGCSATIQFTASENLELDHLIVEEETGYGIKAVGDGKMFSLKIHNNQIRVSPEGKWLIPGAHAAPNIACELYNVDLKECEIYDNYFNANLSIIMDKKEWTKPPDYQTVHVFNNYFDLNSTPHRAGHGVELTVHNVEIDHNYFSGGATSIVNWDASQDAHTMSNWTIHHNVFYNLCSFYPSAVINFFRHGIDNAHIYNNTVELSDTSTINFIEVNNGGIATNVKVENNLIINSSKYNKWYPNKLISSINGASFREAIVSHNSLHRVTVDSLPGVSYKSNLVGDPKIRKQGKRPHPYYNLSSASPLVDRGLKVHDEYSGESPDIGAIEFNPDN